ncbi:hypothetical protein [Acidaminococcus sp. DS4831]|uniref:hypothetical protein n=1 Tax=Acidaminococcus sp. DS4831 TaxID=3141399 RepID=UPI0032E46DC8
MKATKGKRLLLAMLLWGSLLPGAWAAGSTASEKDTAAAVTAAPKKNAAADHLETAQPLAESGSTRQKDLKAELLAKYGNQEKKPVTFKDPRNDVTFSLPEGFQIQGVYARGKKQEDILMRAARGDTLLVYMANGAMMKTDGQKEARPFQSQEVMLLLTWRSYEEEAKAKKIPVQGLAIGTFAGREGIHIRQKEEDKVSDRYFFGDRKNLYSLSFLAAEKEFGTLEPEIQQVLDTLKIGEAYERIELPHTGISYEIPYGAVDVQKEVEPGDLHQLTRLHLDHSLVTAVLYQPLRESLDYAFLPDSLEGLDPRDQANLCRLMTETRKDKWQEKNPGWPLKENKTYFSKAAGRTCLVEEMVTPGGRQLGYVFLQDGMLLSLDYTEMGRESLQKIVDHSVDSLQWKKAEPAVRTGKKGPEPPARIKYGGE